MEYLLGGALGGLIAAVFAVPAVVLELKEKGHAKDAPLIVDARRMFGRSFERREAFLIGLLLHVLFGGLFGSVYVLFVLRGWLFVTHAPYSFLSFVVYACLSWVVAGTLLYPLLGMGLFARKEGRHVWGETLASHLLLGLALWLVVQYYQPYFF